MTTPEQAKQIAHYIKLGDDAYGTEAADVIYNLLEENLKLREALETLAIGIVNLVDQILMRSILEK
jgi:hypothetical protein